MKFTLGPYHLLMLIWCHIAWQAKTNMQSSLRCNQLMLYTTYNTDLRGTSCLSTVVSKSKTYPYLYGFCVHPIWSIGSFHISIIPYFYNLIVSWYSICSQLIDSVTCYAGIYGWRYTLEFEVGCFYDTDSLVTLWLVCRERSSLCLPSARCELYGVE